MAIFIILVVSIALGVLLSRLMAKHGTGKWLRRPLATAAGVLVFLAALGVYLGNSATDTVAVEAPASPAAKPVPKPNPLLAVTSKEYQKALTAALGRNIHGKVEPGAVNDVLSAKLGHGVSLVAGIDKPSNMLKNVMLVVDGATNADDLRAAMKVVASAIDVAAPDQKFDAALDSMNDEVATFGNQPARQVGRYTVSYAMPTSTVLMVGMGAGRLDAARADDHSVYAYTQCEEAVKNRLRSPSTASFPSSADVLRQNPHNGDSYLVMGHVDAQNGFGATIRSTWQCQLAYKADEKDADPFEPSSWQVFDVQIASR